MLIVTTWPFDTSPRSGRVLCVACRPTSSAPSASVAPTAIVSTEPAAGSAVSPKDRMRDLLAYSVSEDYFAVRKVLGLEVM